MTDNKFTDEQIIEALQIRMPHDAICREAYDLITRQKAEIEAKENEYADMLGQRNAVEMALNEAQKKIDRLYKSLRLTAIEQYGNGVEAMAERLKDYYSKSCYRPTLNHPVKHTQIEHLIYIIDQIANELAEGETNE